MNRKALRYMMTAVFCLVLCTAWVAARGEIEIHMEETDWSWEEKSTAAFQGEIINNGETISDVTLALAIETRLEDSGEIQFTHLNGKKLKVRQKGPVLKTDLAGDSEKTVFSGEWFLPSTIQGGLAHATIHLTIQDAEGNTLKTGRLEVGSEAGEEALIGVSPVKRLNQLTLWLIIACAVVWVLAVGRHLVLNRSSI